MTTDTNIVPRLKTVYNDEIRGKLLTELGLSNVMEVPRLEKIVINVGVGGAIEHKQLIDKVVRVLDRAEQDRAIGPRETSRF